MAINTVTKQSYTPYFQQPQVLGATTAVAAGPAPTPVPPSGVAYTPQYSGSQVFSTPNPTTYTQTPQGSAELKAMQTSTGTTPVQTQQQPSSDGFSSNFMSYYQGWDPNAAQQDFMKEYGGNLDNLIKARTGTGSPAITDKQSKITTVAQQKGTDVANDYANYADQMSPEQYYAMIDQEAGNSMNFLNQQEQALRADQPGIEQGITSQAELLKKKAGSVKEDALSAARRLYSELQQGYKQRFGGASSAGEAAMALTGNEQQRQMAATNRSYQESVAQVDQSAAQAINSAQSEFRNALLQINQNRTAVESERLAARRQALSDLSQKVFAIQQQRQAMKDNLTLMAEQARLQNEANLKNLNLNPASTLTTTNKPAVASGNQGINSAIGSITPISNIQRNSSGLYTNPFFDNLMK